MSRGGGRGATFRIHRLTHRSPMMFFSDCIVTLRQPIKKLRNIGNQCTFIAQTFPSFGKVSLRNGCVLTCNGQTGGIGGILAFKARNLSIDYTSKIDMSGKGKWNSMISITRLCPVTRGNITSPRVRSIYRYLHMSWIPLQDKQTKIEATSDTS